MTEENNTSPEEENNQPNPNLFYMSPAILKKLIDEAKPLLDTFFALWTQERTTEEQIQIVRQTGVPGAVGYFIEQSIPENLLVVAPYNFVDLAQRCILFGYSLQEILKRLENKDLSLDELDKLWDVDSKD